MPDRLVIEPSGEPVTVAEVKKQISLETEEDDAFIEVLVAAARTHAEKFCNRGILQQTYELVLDAFPNRCQPLYQKHNCRGFTSSAPCQGCDLYVELAHGHLATLESDDAVTDVTYVDENGAEQTLDPELYSIDDVSVPGRLHRAYGIDWPATRAQWDAVRIEYVVGWATADDVPAAIKQAILLLVSHMYEVRSPEVEKALSQVKLSYEALLSPYRIHYL